MEVTEKKCRVADRIIEILAEENCTVEDAEDILKGVKEIIRNSSTVQIQEKLLEVYHDLLDVLHGK